MSGWWSQGGNEGSFINNGCDAYEPESLFTAPVFRLSGINHSKNYKRPPLRRAQMGREARSVH